MEHFEFKVVLRRNVREHSVENVKVIVNDRETIAYTVFAAGDEDLGRRKDLKNKEVERD